MRLISPLNAARLSAIYGTDAAVGHQPLHAVAVNFLVRSALPGDDGENTAQAYMVAQRFRQSLAE